MSLSLRSFKGQLHDSLFSSSCWGHCRSTCWVGVAQPGSHCWPILDFGTSKELLLGWATETLGLFAAVGKSAASVYCTSIHSLLLHRGPSPLCTVICDNLAPSSLPSQCYSKEGQLCGLHQPGHDCNTWVHLPGLLVHQFSHSVVSDSLRPHGLQHTRLPCPSPTPEACSNSDPLSRWCHPTISSSVGPFFSCLQSFPASGSFPSSQFFASGGQSIGVSASASVLPMKQDWFPLGWTGWISLQSKRLSRVLSKTRVQKHQFFGTQPSLCSNSYSYMTPGKTIALTRRTFVSKVMSLLFNMLSRMAIAFLPRSKHLLISWLQLPSAVILEPPKMKSLTVLLHKSSEF